MRFGAAQRAHGVWKCEVEDKAAGVRGGVQVRTVVNATGPWADQVPHSAVPLQLSKGVHIVIERARLPVPAAIVLPEGRRILFVLPWGERVIIGTTETPLHGPPEAVRAEGADLEYLLSTVNRFFPAVGLGPEDVVSQWAGVRPLIASGSDAVSDISRAHRISSPEPGWWDLAGGKLTTYRLMAEQLVDQVVKELALAAKPCRTALEPLLAPGQLNPFSGILPPAQTRDAIEYYVAHEWALHLEDVLLRRGGWACYDRLPPGVVVQIAGWMGGAAGWTIERRRGEIESWQARSQPIL